MPFYTTVKAMCEECYSTAVICRFDGVVATPVSVANVNEVIKRLAWQVTPIILCPKCKLKESKKVKKDAYDFVHIWQTSESAEEVAEKLDWTLKAVRARAEHYRRIGIELKRFGNGGEELDVQSLAEYADSLQDS